MSIRVFLDGHSTFDSEHVESMSAALADVLAALGLKDKTDDKTVIVAQKIINLAKAGQRDPERLKAAALNLRHCSSLSCPRMPAARLFRPAPRLPSAGECGSHEIKHDDYRLMVFERLQ